MAGQGIGDWFSNLGGDVGHYVGEHPWQAAAALGTAVAAPFLLPEIGALAGFGGAAEGALGGAATEGALGFAGAEGGGLSASVAGDALLGGDAAFAGADALLPPGATPTAFEGAATSPYGSLTTTLPDAGATVNASSLTGSGATGSEPGIWDKLVAGATKSATSNPLGIAAAGGGLALNMLRGNPDSPEAKKLREQAAQLGSQGQALQQYLANGTLPPAMQAQLDNATKAAKARIISNHARNGMPTDPSQNSALAQELNAADMNAVAAMGQAQIDMMKTGLSETGLSTQLYEMLVKMDRQNNTDLMNAISSFASALGGGSKTVQLKMA